MENIALLILVGVAAFFGTLSLFALLAQITTSEIEKMVPKLPPPPRDIADIDYELLIPSNMTKYRVISRVLCDAGETCTFFYPQRKTWRGWKNIKQNGETVKFRSRYEAFKYVDGAPLATKVEQRPSKSSNYIDCWIYHTSARTNVEDLREFLQPSLEDFTIYKHHGYMMINMSIDDDCRSDLPVRPGDCVIRYPDGPVYVVPNLDTFPYLSLKTK